ncbi:hypothetical protein C8J56DRAFT_1174000 [Mycena floridula]|nr:hypothetical protein C8J56DRAFT_1174000 [Mycena floridula]
MFNSFTSTLTSLIQSDRHRHIIVVILVTLLGQYRHLTKSLEALRLLMSDIECTSREVFRRSDDEFIIDVNHSCHHFERLISQCRVRYYGLSSAPWHAYPVSLIRLRWAISATRREGQTLLNKIKMQGESENMQILDWREMAGLFFCTEMPVYVLAALQWFERTFIRVEIEGNPDPFAGWTSGVSRRPPRISRAVNAWLIPAETPMEHGMFDHECMGASSRRSRDPGLITGRSTGDIFVDPVLVATQKDRAPCCGFHSETTIQHVRLRNPAGPPRPRSPIPNIDPSILPQPFHGHHIRTTMQHLQYSNRPRREDDLVILSFHSAFLTDERSPFPFATSS